jgi:hypothetical protein
MNDGKGLPELKNLIQIILKESDQNVKEVRHDHKISPPHCGRG